MVQNLRFAQGRTQQPQVKLAEIIGEEGTHNCYGHQSFRDTSNKVLQAMKPQVN